jgi:hypothetical protein
MHYPTIWHWRFAQYSDEDLRAWIRRSVPGDESEIDLIAIKVLAGRVVANSKGIGFKPAENCA